MPAEGPLRRRAADAGPGVKLKFDRPFFKEFTIEVPADAGRCLQSC